MRELIHIDLFAGAGGFAAGLRPCGYRTAVAVEFWRPAAATFALNQPGVAVIRRDIREVTGGEVASYLPVSAGRRREADLLTAGVPCQTFSRAGRHTHDTYDYRQTLFREVVRIAKATQPRIVCIENVPDIRAKPITPNDTTMVAEAIRQELAEAGYVNQAEGVLLAADDDPDLWAAVLDAVLKDAGAVCSGGTAARPAVCLVGRCSHWLRPHQTRWTADGGFAWPSGYLGRRHSRTGLPELDWSVAFAWDPATPACRPGGTPLRGSLVFRVTVPARSARHHQAAVHTIWTPRSPVRPQQESTQFYGFRKKGGRWACTAYRGDEGLYEKAAEQGGAT